jgi:anti-anti-sigma factor
MVVMEQALIDSVRVFRLTGVLGAGSHVALHEVVQQCLARGEQSFVLSAAGLTHMDSIGIAMVVASYTSIMRAGGRLVLAGITPHVEKVLQITRLLRIFETCPTESEAIARLSGRSPESSGGTSGETVRAVGGTP